ncbi:acylneuraminate cytidylyltransferase family protein [Paenibacillus sp. FSL R5-0744]|uniref:acylneuraminate cytidylyltransferase family protein n=1 Tax=Paenibacillus sp. FSL R5-0744 TaxID=2921656 RepID=UPI0030DA927D
MIGNKKILAIIPARGGSKGVPHKNIKKLAGKPLISWTIEEAKKSRYIDRLILSSDDHKIIEIARSQGCDAPFIRPKHLSEDTTPGIDPVLHAINQLPSFDYVVLLQPTSPLRLVEDIDGCIENIVNMGAPACVSVTKTNESPYWMYTLKENNMLKQLIVQEKEIERRQELPEVYYTNGAVYVADVNWLLKSGTFLEKETVAYVMPRNRSNDIDTEEDFLICEYFLGRVHKLK